MKITFFYVIFLFAIVGCAQSPLSKVQQEVETQVKLLVDSGYIQNKYVVLYELVINDSNHIYKIADSEFPVDANLELPSKITKYKDKYFCFVEFDEPEMSVEDMVKITHYSGNPIVETNFIYKWFFGVSSFGQKKILIDLGKDENSYFDYPELWPYFPGYVKDYPVQMGVASHDIRMYNDQKPFNVDSIRKQSLEWTKNIYGKIYLKNNTDSTLCLSSSTLGHYAVVNNKDTLYLSLCDSLPIVLCPYESREIRYESIPNKRFFENLVLQKDPWEYFYNLFGKSTYCFMKINQEDLKTRVMSLDRTNGFRVADGNGEYVFKILNHGIYDKVERCLENTKLWIDLE